MTKQEIYDTVCAHLAKQKVKSRNIEGCLYRGPNNTSCAVGCLITDAEYDPLMDSVVEGGTGVYMLFSKFPSVAERLGKDNLEFLSKLQATHDYSNSPTILKMELRYAATEFGVNAGAEEAITQWV